jgi:hypothetical protein
MGIWFVDFGIRFGNGQVNNLPFIGRDQTQVLGTIIFNYAGTMTIPSWANEKHPSVPVRPSVWISTLFTSVMMGLVGFLGAMAYSVPANSDILSVINDSPEASIVTQIAVYVFPFAGVTTSIPIFSIIIRYNLLENEICGKGWAFFWSVIFPWLVIVPFYTGTGLLTLINWASLIFCGATNFVIPFIIYIKARTYKLSQDAATRRMLDEVSDLTGDEEDDVYCCGTIRVPPKPPAKPHFGLPRKWHHDTVSIIAGCIAAIMIILVVGTIIMNLLHWVEPARIWNGYNPPPTYYRPPHSLSPEEQQEIL